MTFRDTLRQILVRTRTFGIAHGARRHIRLLTDGTYRASEHGRRKALQAFSERHGEALASELSPNGLSGPRALLIGFGVDECIRLELPLLKILEMAGFRPVVLTERDGILREYYGLLGNTEVVYWDQYRPALDYARAAALVDEAPTVQSFLELEVDGIRVGRFAAATAMKALRVGELDLQSDTHRRSLELHLASSLRYVLASRHILDELRSDTVLFVDRGYTPQAELFDTCLNRGLDAITWNTAHKSSTLLFKRYDRHIRDEHYSSLSAKTWDRLRKASWEEAKTDRVRDELRRTYESQDWYSEVGTQFNARTVDRQQILASIGVDRDKKVAVIFPHIVWDGSFFWGDDLLGNYRNWLVETLKAAAANDRVNWVVKIHPANTTKNARAGLDGMTAEEQVVRDHLGELPDHMFLLPPETEISTYSLFAVADYCLTVRGTVGMEAALFGIPVITAGTGRYDRRGFTVDSDSPEAYLAKLAHIEDVPPLTPEESELAAKFAYGVFIERPCALTSYSVTYRKEHLTQADVRLNVERREDWLAADDLVSLASWLKDGSESDYLHPQSVGDGSRVETA